MVRRRHPFVRIFRRDSLHQRRRIRIAGLDDPTVWRQNLAGVDKGDLGDLLHATVAGEAMSSENRPDVPMEANPVWNGRVAICRCGLSSEEANQDRK
jgi:hypothetical protein